MTTIPLKLRSISKLLSQPSALFSLATMPRFLHTARQEQARHLPWKVSNMDKERNKEESYRAQWRKYLRTLGLNRLSKARLWCVLAICRSIMRQLATYSRQKEQVCRFVRMLKEVSLLKGFQNGQCVHQVRPTIWWFEDSKRDQQPQLKWMMLAVALTQYS